MIHDLFLLALFWVLWCSLHSLLVFPPAAAWVQRSLGIPEGAYRFLYNLLALATLVPVLLFSFSLNAPEIIVWRGPWVLLQGLCWVLAALLVAAGARVYPLRDFLGWPPRGKGEGAAAPPKLVREGILGRIRHPWYTALFLLLWARDLSAPSLLVSLLLSLYLVVGARFEERRLVELFGDEYRRYRAEVPPFFPRWRGPGGPV